MAPRERRPTPDVHRRRPLTMHFWASRAEHSSNLLRRRPVGPSPAQTQNICTRHENGYNKAQTSWLDRAGDLNLVSTHQRGFCLPPHKKECVGTRLAPSTEVRSRPGNRPSVTHASAPRCNLPYWHSVPRSVWLLQESIKTFFTGVRI